MSGFQRCFRRRGRGGDDVVLTFGDNVVLFLGDNVVFCWVG